MQKKSNIGKNLFAVVILVILLFGLSKIYKQNNFNDYIKAEYNSGNSKFTRDSQVKYSKQDSYKIENIDYNDTIFYKVVKVTPDTPYKVSCKIKTENVQSKKENSDSGAHISISESIEKSDNITRNNRLDKC